MAKQARQQEKKQGRKFDGNFKAIPSPKMLQALVIRSIESGEDFRLPKDRNEALAMLGYEPREARG